MSTSYFMNIGAYVATVIFAAARLAVGGVLTEPGALVPALQVLGILLIPLASKGGFQIRPGQPLGWHGASFTPF